MKRLIFICLSIISLNTLSYTQSIKGRISNSNGDPVPFATVYVSEKKHGTTTNIKGEYQLNLEPGYYTIFFQSLGYTPEVRKVEIGTETKTINISLSVQYYVIPEVRVTSTGEDPAYAIMRKAIGLAPYYLNHIEHYRAEVYIKGSFIIRKIPRIMQRNLEVNEETLRTDETYMIESLNDIEFNAPNEYIQNIIAQQSTLPDAGSTDISPMDVVKASFYEPVLADVAISPLAPNAFAHYKFRYEGSTPQGSYVINKISVIPRRKSQQVFSGTIYIIEGLWCLHSLELSNENIAGRINITQLYAPVEENIWMPVSHKFDVDVSIVGVKGDGEYGSAITYNDVRLNTQLEKPEAISEVRWQEETPEYETEIPRSKEQEKIEEILKKEELTNREMVRLSRLMNKEAEKKSSEEESLEIVSTRTFTVADDADNKDSLYWNMVRPIPLSDEEIRSIRVNDSLKYIKELRIARRNSTMKDTIDNLNKGRFRKTLNDITFGRSFNSSDKSLSLRFGGIFNLERISFNPVDGLYYGTDLRLWKRWDKGPFLSIRPSAEWAFAREKPRYRISASLQYDRMRMGRFYVIAGSETRDYNRRTGISPGLNMLSSLFWKENYMKLYGSKYLVVSDRHELFNGFYSDLRYNFEERTPLNNYTNFSFLKKDDDYKPNLPANDYLPDPVTATQAYGIGYHTHHSAELRLTWVPKQRYRISNGAKSSAGSDYPTFRLNYKHGINISDDDTRGDFDLLSLEASKTREIGAFAEYRWKVSAGGFLNNEGARFQDFVHFNSQPVPVMLKNYSDVFMLPSYYSLSTPEYYLEGHFRFTTPYLLIKLLPVLSNTLMRENISLAYLYTPATGHYTELGYTISELFLIGRLGIYTGFEDFKYKGAGIRFTLLFD